MCRLYALRATHPTIPTCELLKAQNSLFKQAGGDERGWANPHGWGIVDRLADGSMDYDREPKPADQSEEYRREATETPAIATIAHIRRATVGEPKLENTHPFVGENAALAHNGHIGAFEEVGAHMRTEMKPKWRDAIQGSTDSEHVFALLMSRLPERTPSAMVDTMVRTIRDIAQWTDERGTECTLNLMWLVDDHLIGSRFHRTLHYSLRDHAYRCPECGESHGPDVPTYRAVVLASEPITAEHWHEVPDEVVWSIDPEWQLVTRSVR